MKKKEKNKKEKSQIFANLPQLEFLGNKKLIIDCCDSILEYQTDTIKLKFKSFNVLILGRDLLLNNLSGQSIMITGYIYSVDFTA